VLPTPTPVIHVIEPNDTFISVALLFNVSVEALQAANPDKNPQFLLVGDELIIPVGDQIPIEPTPTAFPLPAFGVECHPTLDGGLWCFTLFPNETAEILENLSALISLHDLNGQEIASQVAYGLLNILPLGEAMPLAAYFPPPIAYDLYPRAQILTAIQIQSDDPRYLPVQLQNTAASITWSGKTARVTGQVVSLSTQQAQQVWVLGVAYDNQDAVIGLRRWEAEGPLIPNGNIPFVFTLSSVGPDINRVELLVEARP
jgi:LysM repeat protein